MSRWNTRAMTRLGKLRNLSVSRRLTETRENALRRRNRLIWKRWKKLEKLKKQIAKLEASISAENDEGDKGNKKNDDESKDEAVKNISQEQVTSVEKPAKHRPRLEDVDQTTDVSAWKGFKLAEPILNALKYHKFMQPTPIQEKTIPRALDGRDIIGAAETGSGKTLAFGMPIVQYILTTKEKSDGLIGLILTPTRELAIQVKDHIENIAIFTSIKVAAIVGGMSMQKQQRVLKNNPSIIVATPGRLWEIFSGNTSYMDMLKNIKFLVLDEADRMLEKGRFEELSNILDTLSNKKRDTTDWPEESGDATTKVVPRATTEYQTFVFTATLSKELRFHKSKKFKAAKGAPGSMQHLLERLDLGKKNPAIIDITTETAVASRLLEAKIDCLKTDKDLFVYYFVTRYPGRTIVFVNSIDAIRRLIPVFKLLGIEVLGLHAQMQQRQRLKNLDRFKMNDKAVLVASDVAARGLDIPLVEHVIHYQLPRSGEIYVHRSGRTARANRDGVSLLLCGPEEVKLYTKLCHTLRKGEQYPDFPVDLGILNEMKKRVNLAVEIDKLEHSDQKEAHEDNWLRRMAEEMDVEYDDDEEDEDRTKGKKNKAKIHSKKSELKHLLAMPMLPFGVSRKYFTGGQVEGLADIILQNSKKGKSSHDYPYSCNPSSHHCYSVLKATLLPAHASTQAKEDLSSSKKTRK
ncbi:P-loop containing nucleoside triphosphate hydrolase protein [Dichotomocladium elegans]|nr:P-loop containing nucleoside triphosphate hydrolase protein [Dichotomocladium elegans]